MRGTEKRKSSLNSKKTDVYVSVVPSQSSFQPCQQPGSNSILSPENQELGSFLPQLFGRLETVKIMILWPVTSDSSPSSSLFCCWFLPARFPGSHDWGCVPCGVPSHDVKISIALFPVLRIRPKYI